MKSAQDLSTNTSPIVRVPCNNADDSEQLDPKVAQYPHELITYGGNGSVFQNWAQYLVTMEYLSKMEEDQTLVMYSGHPWGYSHHHQNPRE